MASAPFSYLFLLGTTPALSWLELKTVSQRHDCSVSKINNTFAATKDNIDPTDMLSQLGGTVKILQPIQETSNATLKKDISTYLNQKDISRYAISGPPNLDTKALLKAIKSTLRDTSRSARYKLTSDWYYSALDDTYTEMLIIKLDDQLFLTQTVAVQDIDYWSHKDYGRPAVDPKSGMLPPKVARMMVNLSLPRKITTDTTVYDPFCGSGTVLMEAMELGCQVLGSDIDKTAVADTRTNLAWFAKELERDTKVTVFQKDVTTVVPSDIKHPVDSIVFEGFLGPPNIKPNQFDQYIKGLNNLYLGALKKLHPLLKSNGTLVAALPEYHAQGRVKKLDRLVDSCEKLGYTRSSSRVTYGKNNATVKRTILQLTKK